MIGTFLSASGRNRSVCEGLADRLAALGQKVLTCSRHCGRLRRMADIVQTVWRHRNDYQVAQIDVYSGPAFLWAETACWLLRRLRKPVVLTLHGGNLPRFARRHPRRVGRLLRAAAQVTTPSGYLHHEMRELRSDLTVLPNPIDVGAYESAIRREIQPRLVWLRAFDDTYNPQMAVRVVAELRSTHPEVCLTMVGPDKGTGSLAAVQSLARQLGISNQLSFPGGVPKSSVPAWLSRGDVFLNTSNVDNTPVSVLEAMACGLCVVSTDVGGMPYLIQDGVNGHLVPINDHLAAAQAIRGILDTPAAAERLSRGARATAETCDWSVILPRWLELLRKVVEEHDCVSRVR